jgi:uncharacterized membrane protein
MSSQMQVVVARFPGEDDASEALKTIKAKDLKSGSAAVLSKDEEGKIRIKETNDWGAGKGAAAGAVAGAILPVVGWVGGAIIGGAAAKLHDGGFPDDKLKAMAHSLESNSSMFLMLTDPNLVSVVEGSLSELGGQVEINQTLSEDLSTTINEAVETEETEG